MSRTIVLLTLLYLFLHPAVCRSVDPQSAGVAMRPVKQLPSHTTSTAEIDFSDFEIQQMFLSNHPGMNEITKGFRFFVRAWIYGWEAIATAKFEAVDVNGNFLQKILIQREPDPLGGSEFYGVIRGILSKL